MTGYWQRWVEIPEGTGRSMQNSCDKRTAIIRIPVADG